LGKQVIGSDFELYYLSKTGPVPRPRACNYWGMRRMKTVPRYLVVCHVVQVLIFVEFNTTPWQCAHRCASVVWHLTVSYFIVGLCQGDLHPDIAA